MATRIFQLNEADYFESLARKRIPQGAEICSDSNDYQLPHVRCPACRLGGPGDERDLPESLNLPPDHPVMRRVKAIWRRRRKQAREADSGFFEPVSWEEYESVTAEVRAALGLPPDRLLAPCTQLGPHRYLVEALPVADVDLVPLSDLVASPRFIEWLEREGITGWAAEPVLLRYQRRRPEQEPELQRLRITGRAGQAANVKRPQVCHLCGGRLNFWGGNPDHLELDEPAWDRSGMFRFRGFPAIYVTEAVKEAMETAGYTTVKFTESVSS